jgi:ubiquinone/menaquinone biosynthesis C-methylase UbiE
MRGVGADDPGAHAPHPMRHNPLMSSFDERAAAWDSPDRVDRALSVADALRAVIPLTPDLRVIEIGAGTGLLGFAIAREVGSLVLADASPGMLAEADAKIAAAGFDNVRTVRFELTVDPLPAERFDLALSLMALHHVPDTDAALAALAALLDPGGWLALVDLDAEDGTFHTEVDPDVHLGFGREDLGRKAEAAGFRDVAFTTAYRIAKGDRTYPLFLLTARRP